MIRILFGGSLALLGLGAAAAVLSPSLLTGPRGEPLVMVAPEEASLQPATFDGRVCPSTLLFSGYADGANTGFAGTHIVAFALRSGEKDVAVGIEDFSDGAKATSKTVVLVFDDAGHLVAAGDPASLHLQADPKLTASCLGTGDSDPRAPI